MGRNAFHNFFGNGPSLSLAPFYNELLSQYNVAIVVAIGVCIYVCVSGNLIKYSIAFLDGVPSGPHGSQMTRLGLPIKNMASWQHQLLTASTQMFISRKTLLIKKVRHGVKASGLTWLTDGTVRGISLPD